MSTLAGFSESAAAPSGFVGARWPWPSLSSIEIQSSSNFKYVVGPGRVDYPSNLKSRLHRISLVYHPSAWSSIEIQSSSNFARGPAIIHRSLVVIRRLVPESIIHRNPVAIELGSATEAIIRIESIIHRNPALQLWTRSAAQAEFIKSRRHRVRVGGPGRVSSIEIH